MFFIRISKKKIKSLFFKKKYVLIWNDHDTSSSQKICQILKSNNNEYFYEVIDEPRDLLYYPVGNKFMKVIIFFVTDVTKFSEKPKERILIEQKIITHLKGGGTFIGTHDVIYRRCRNRELEFAFGCQLNNFKRTDKPIEAQIVIGHETNPLLRGLDKVFLLDDGEVCWGDWEQDVNIIVETKKGFNGRKKVPLIVTRRYSFEGLLIWFNSGDKFLGLPTSIAKPEESLIKLISNTIEFEAEIKALS